MAVAHQLARLTAQSAQMEPLPGGGVPEVTREMVAQAAAALDDDFAYYLVMGKYTACMNSKREALPMIGNESRRIWKRAARGQIRKPESLDLLTILAHATYYSNPEGVAHDGGPRPRALTAAERARFCQLSEASWHARWGEQFADLMRCMDYREGVLMRWIAKNIWRMK